MAKNKKWYNNGEINKQFSDTDIIPENFIEGMISNHNISYKWYNNGKTELKLPSTEEIPEGFVKGRLLNNKKWYTNGKDNLKLSTTDIIPEGFKLGRTIKSGCKNKNRIPYNNGVLEIRLLETEEIPEGFVKGRLKSNIAKYTIKGKKCYNNSVKNIYLDINEEIPEGFIEGSLQKFRSEEDNKAIIEKRNKTRFERYGNKGYTNREKAKNTCLEKYGTEYPAQCEDIKNKEKNYFIEKYGVDNPWKVAVVKEKIRDKSKQTMQERYGVDYACLLPQCSEALSKVGKDSKPNIDFANLLESNNIEYSREFPIKNRRYDFKVGNTLIEIDPSATHNSTWGIFNQQGLDKFYHREKTELARENGFNCIHVFDWEDMNKIVNLLKSRETVYARKCLIKEVDKKEAKEYLDKYHLQNYARDNIRIGLYYNNQIVSIMTFDKPRYNNKYQYELVRYCSHFNVIGGAEKLFKYFIDKYNPESIVSYCDNSKFTGKVYKKLGFELKNKNGVSKHWYNGELHITDNFLRQRGFDQLFGTDFGKGTSNDELMILSGFVEIYDCGQYTWIWSKS